MWAKPSDEKSPSSPPRHRFWLPVVVFFRVARIWDFDPHITYVVYIRIRRIYDVLTYTYLYVYGEIYMAYSYAGRKRIRINAHV
jgi:hypothetical protein